MAHNADVVREAASGHLGADRRLVAMQQEANTLAAMTFAVVAHTRHYNGRSVVAAHGVERNQDRG
jgi:hypothetical protein